MQQPTSKKRFVAQGYDLTKNSLLAVDLEDSAGSLNECDNVFLCVGDLHLTGYSYNSADDVIDPTETGVVNHISFETGGVVDIAFEVAGIEITFNDTIRSTRPSGTVTVVSIWEEEVRTHPNELVLGERTLTGTLAYLGGPPPEEEYGVVIDMLADGCLDLEPLSTDTQLDSSNAPISSRTSQ